MCRSYLSSLSLPSASSAPIPTPLGPPTRPLHRPPLVPRAGTGGLPGCKSTTHSTNPCCARVLCTLCTLRPSLHANRERESWKKKDEKDKQHDRAIIPLVPSSSGFNRWISEEKERGKKKVSASTQEQGYATFRLDRIDLSPHSTRLGGETAREMESGETQWLRGRNEEGTPGGTLPPRDKEMGDTAFVLA